MPKNTRPKQDNEHRLREQIGQRIAHLRERHTPKLAQNKLATDAGIDPATMNKIERGHAMPDTRTILSIARVLGVPAGLILDGEIPATVAAHDRQQEQKPQESPAQQRLDISAAIQEAAAEVVADFAATLIEALGAWRAPHVGRQDAGSRTGTTGKP
jgi:transcriptional regulator with XRE-family HTH domain